MSVSGLCEICESKPVEDGCDQCGRLVCAEHYDDSSGRCMRCQSEFAREPTEKTQREYPDGVEEYRF